MMLKKNHCAVMALLLVLLLLAATGCSATQKGPEFTQETTETTTTRSSTVRVTFPEGLTVSQIADLLETNEVCSAADFRAAANDARIAANYSFSQNLDGENRPFLLEGYVFPDTYDFYYEESANQAITRFLSNAGKKLDGLDEQASALGYTLDEILTIASIIQEESTPEQMNNVSSVLHNRLDSGTKLQCDVTIAYLNNSVIPYLDGDTERYNSFYNTYKCDALPEGPICSPGMQAIEAALNPSETDYLFFVTDKTDPSIFYFSVTYEDHLKNCETAGW